MIGGQRLPSTVLEYTRYPYEIRNALFCTTMECDSYYNGPLRTMSLRQERSVHCPYNRQQFCIIERVALLVLTAAMNFFNNFRINEKSTL